MPGGLALELHGGDDPDLVIVQGSDRVIVRLTDAKLVLAAIGNGAADLAGVLAGGGVYQA